MKTLLQINSVSNWGSTGRIAEDIGSLAIENGWQSYIAYGRNKRQSKSQSIRIGNNWDMMIHGICTRLFDMHAFASEKATIELVRKIKEITPDVILLHNLHGYYLNIKVLFQYLSIAGIPVVWTLHDCWAVTGHCVHFDFVGCDRWKSECYSCPQKKSYPGSILLDRSRTNFKLKKEIFNSVTGMVIVSVSEWLATIIRHSYLGNHGIKVIHNGIDLNTFAPQSDNGIIRARYMVGDRFMILGVASVWNERKGLKDFILLSEKLHDDCVIVLVGLSKKQLRGLPSRIIGITRIENIRELTGLYSASDLYVNPTWEDNFPTTNIEALACGTPVVTYRTGGSIEAVSSHSGFVVEKGDIDALLNIVTQVKEHGKFTYSGACRERALKNFNKQECFKKYIDLFDTLIKRTEGHNL